MFTTGSAQVRTGTHQRDQLPRDGGRWPISVVLRPAPDSELAHTLDALTAEAACLAGTGHWQTGQLGSAHLTVRALEPRRDHIPLDDPAVARYLAALDRAAVGTTWPVGFHLTGLTLTPGSVMACAEPVDTAADTFSDRLASELGPDGRYETVRRDIWYLNLVHFTGDIPYPDRLIDWVAARRTTGLGTAVISAPELERSEYCGGARPHMRPVEVMRAL